jgi:hypothetical protein
MDFSAGKLAVAPAGAGADHAKVRANPDAAYDYPALFGGMGSAQQTLVGVRVDGGGPGPPHSSGHGYGFLSGPSFIRSRPVSHTVATVTVAASTHRPPSTMV